MTTEAQERCRQQTNWVRNLSKDAVALFIMKRDWMYVIAWGNSFIENTFQPVDDFTYVLYYKYHTIYVGVKPLHRIIHIFTSLIIYGLSKISCANIIHT